jgi:hypothetical protein
MRAQQVATVEHLWAEGRVVSEESGPLAMIEHWESALADLRERLS